MAAASEVTAQQHHTAIVLFYKYFLPYNTYGAPSLVQQYPEHYVGKLQAFAKELCVQLRLKGRLLIASEGINGTVSAESRATLQQFVHHMEEFALVRELGLPAHVTVEINDDERLFEHIDWKISSIAPSSGDDATKHNALEPFPDLKVSIVKEIISTGGAVSVDKVRDMGGTHLSPTEFHKAILENPDAVLIDVRNTFEHAIGHFVHPSTQQAALNPETVTFSSFDATFCAANADKLKDRKVLMYCTGGIRCEKASVMLKQRGIKDVSQLSGGIHRYLETFGDEGYFRGKNFVFDQRGAQKPSECKVCCTEEQSKESGSLESKDIVVGQCIECSAPFDELCGSRLCTVCRDLVLVCPACQNSLREYHCARHAPWKNCYFTFMEVFDRDELSTQKKALLALVETFRPASEHRNVRRTLARQVAKISQQIDALGNGSATVNRDAPRRCRTCSETSDICDGRCWGFWKSKPGNEPPPSIAVGDTVQPGPDWPELRLGCRTTASGELLRGKVVEVTTWGAGSTVLDSVSVTWDCNDSDRAAQPLRYRWGLMVRNGQRVYDVARVNSYC